MDIKLQKFAFLFLSLILLIGCEKSSVLTSKFVPTPVPGACDETNHYQCLNRTTPDNTRKEDGFYKWSCLGLNNGKDVHTCQQAVPVDGQCDETNHYQCLNGTTPDNTRKEDRFYKWSCLGLNNGKDVHTCQQAVPVDGQCDETNHYQCLNGTTVDNTRKEDGFYKWSCLGLNNGKDIHTCSKTATLIKQDSFEVIQTSSSLQMKVDILMIIDNSISMQIYQQQLGSRFGNLSSKLGVNWQMAFINTDRTRNNDGYQGVFYNLENAHGEFENNGNKVQILTPALPNAQDLFLNTINRSETESSGQEYPFINFITAIGRSQNQTFFRNGAALATIILTNEGNDTTTADEVITAVEKQFGSEKRFFAYAIICATPCPSVNSDENGYTSRIKKLVAQTGGIVGDINAGDYSNTLQNISQSLENNLTLIEVPLRHQNVISNSISLTFIPSSNSVGWNFEGSSNKVVFDKRPPENTRIQLSYSYQVY